MENTLHMMRGQEREEEQMALRIFSTKNSRLVWQGEEGGEEGRRKGEREGERGRNEGKVSETASG